MRRDELQSCRNELNQTWKKFTKIHTTLEIREDQRKNKRKTIVEKLTMIDEFFKTLIKNLNKTLECLPSETDEMTPPENWKEFFIKVEIPLKKIHAFTKNDFPDMFKQMEEILNIVQKWRFKLSV